MVLMPAGLLSALSGRRGQRGGLPEGGVTLDTGDAYVFRREPSDDPARMQIFHMREIVRIADRDTVVEWREGWRMRAVELLGSLGLDVELEMANDPFFGRSRAVARLAQRGQELKWELLAPVAGNAHRDRVLELSPGPLRPYLRAGDRPTASPPTPGAWRSARSG